MKRTLLLMGVLGLLLSLVVSIRIATSAHQQMASRALVTTGSWQAHNYDLVYTVSFSSEQQPNGPLVVYRAAAADLRTTAPVIAFARSSLPMTPLFFPSHDGRYLALVTPLNSNANGASLRIVSSEGSDLAEAETLAQHISANDQPVWSADSRSIYYHTVIQDHSLVGAYHLKGVSHSSGYVMNQSAGYDEVHHVDLQGHDAVLLHRVQDGSSLRLIGVDASNALIATLARPHQAVSLLHVDTHNNPGSGPLHPAFKRLPVLPTLPPDILPGNVLRVGDDGASVVCERVLSWSPLRYTLVQISLADGTVSHVKPLFETAHYARNGLAPMALSRSTDGHVLVMSQMMSVRHDLARQGIANVPAQEALLLADGNATQQLTLPPGGQVVQAFWTPRAAMSQWHIVPNDVLAGLLAFHKRQSNSPGLNASPMQQDEWMLEGHAGLLFDAPSLPKLCYGACPNGPNGPPHVSAAVVHGVAFVESNWHQFNTNDYRVGSEPIGSPIESFDGGWGEFQQTWGMPPQCTGMGNCRSDVAKVEHDQSYNIGVGISSLMDAWNSTAGVASSSDPNDPYKANQWFFAVWAYNGSYGNNPNDVPSSVYGQWYPGAPFRTIYEEYVWYFAAHPQNATSGWTDGYVPSLGSNLLPPQSDFAGTSDSFVSCVTCTIPEWTSGSYDRDWVGVGMPDGQTAGYFKTTFAQSGGEDSVGLPRDNGGGAAAHRWGSGWTQDFGGGSYLPGALMLADGTTTSYWVYGSVWTQYLDVNQGATGCHGYPTSSLSPYANSGLGSDTYLRQTFQHGSIVWDATTKSIVADACS